MVSDAVSTRENPAHVAALHAPLKIAITNAFLPSEQPSGVPSQVHHLANALVAAGHAVTVFSFSAKPDDATYGVHQFPRPPVPPRFFPFVMAYRLATTDFSAFDVVNVHGDNYLMHSGRPIVRTFHGAAGDELKSAKTLRRKLFFAVTIPLERIGSFLADHVVGVSETTRASIPRVQTVIPCGVDLNAFTVGKKTAKPTVLFVGTEDGRKRGAWLAEIFTSKVLPAVPTAELRMVSGMASIEPGVRRFGRLPGEELAELYRSSWAFCLPSTYEGFGVPYIESMAAGTAVVATSPNPGACEVLADGAFGAYVSDDRLAETLIHVLTDAGLRADMERRGRERCLAFAWPTIVDRYVTVFRAAMARKTVP
jgi:phosphatidylinositol alpha-mannosyltransferase